MGGFGVKYTDLLTNQQEYSPLNYLTGWVTLQTTGKVWQGSVFACFTKGLGSNDAITGAVYARDADIANAYRLAPMLSYTNGKFVLATEVEMTTAAFGKPDKQYKVQNVSTVSNTRISILAGYFF